MSEGFPFGTVVELDPGVRQLTATVLYGGSPARLLRLNPPGCVALDRLRAGPVADRTMAQLARRLVDGGLAHPVAGPAERSLTVTVVVPVRDRADLLAGCLAAAGSRHPVLVVDDGSRDPAAVAAVCERHGARLHRRERNGGPAAARNTAIELLDTDLLAFLDSDCEPERDWVDSLSGHFRDPAVVAVAPRVMAAVTGFRLAERYGRARSPLDLGDRPGRVASMTRISYVPTAALVVRRSALDGARFEESMRYGEDVDLVWRLIAAGGRIRYNPTVLVGHNEPATWAGLLTRRHHYGTSAAVLSRRHPGRLAPLVLQPWPTVTVAAVLARRPVAAGAAVAAATGLLTRRIRALDVPATGTLNAVAAGAWQTGLGVGRWVDQFALALPVAVAIRPGGRSARVRRGRRLSAAALVVTPLIVEWWQRRPPIDPVRFAAAVLADQLAYGLGVWHGCLRERTLAPLRPAVRWRSARATGDN